MLTEGKLECRNAAICVLVTTWSRGGGLQKYFRFVFEEEQEGLHAGGYLLGELDGWKKFRPFVASCGTTISVHCFGKMSLRRCARG